VQLIKYGCVMQKNKFDLHKVRENLSGVEQFAHKHMIETLTVAAILVGAFSSWVHLFVGTLAWSVLFLVIGSALGIYLPHRMDMVMKKVYSFSRGSSPKTMYIAEGVKIIVALLLPFVYFGFLGIMTGTAYHYYVHFSQNGNKGNKAA
jgi:hypothetical protein